MRAFRFGPHVSWPYSDDGTARRFAIHFDPRAWQIGFSFDRHAIAIDPLPTITISVILGPTCAHPKPVAFIDPWAGW